MNSSNEHLFKSSVLEQNTESTPAEEFYSVADSDLWPLCVGGQVQGISLQGTIMRLIRMFYDS